MPSQSRLRRASSPKGEPTHLRGQMEFTVKLLAALDSAEAEDRVAIASPFGRGVSASR